jgi:hypothetical protein
MGEHGLTGIASSLQLNVPREGKGALVVEAAGELQLKLVKKTILLAIRAADKL